MLLYFLISVLSLGETIDLNMSNLDYMKDYMKDKMMTNNNYRINWPSDYPNLKWLNPIDNTMDLCVTYIKEGILETNCYNIYPINIDLQYKTYCDDDTSICKNYMVEIEYN